MKINFETAKKIAREYKPDVNHCAEGKEAFVFTKKGEFTLNDSPVVVMKDNGEVVNMLWYMTNIPYEDPVREIDF